MGLRGQMQVTEAAGDNIVECRLDGELSCESLASNLLLEFVIVERCERRGEAGCRFAHLFIWRIV